MIMKWNNENVPKIEIVEIVQGSELPVCQIGCGISQFGERWKYCKSNWLIRLAKYVSQIGDSCVSDWRYHLMIDDVINFSLSLFGSKFSIIWSVICFDHSLCQSPYHSHSILFIMCHSYHSYRSCRSCHSSELASAIVLVWMFDESTWNIWLIVHRARFRLADRLNDCYFD